MGRYDSWVDAFKGNLGRFEVEFDNEQIALILDWLKDADNEVAELNTMLSNMEKEFKTTRNLFKK